MRKSAIALAATPFLVFALASCSGSTTTTTTTPAAPTAVPSTDTGGGGDAQAKVDAYCAKVTELATKAQELKQNPDATVSEELSKQADELATQAQQLTGAVISDPSLAQQISECSQEAGKILGN